MRRLNLSYKVKLKNYVKGLLVELLDQTLGKLVRLVYRMWREAFRVPVPSLYDSVLVDARKFQSKYFLEQMPNAMLFFRREQVWKYATRELADKKSILVEFGVFEGYSLNYFSRLLPSACIYGFDSFEGLQEDWIGTPMTKGALWVGGKLPRVPSNVKLIKGWFEETLPNWLSATPSSFIDLIHIDSDTYTPASYVLAQLSQRLKEGTIIIFDEYFGYPGWDRHEFKAWKEFVEQRNVRYTYLAVAEECVAIRVLGIG